jgi:tropomyosin
LDADCATTRAEKAEGELKDLTTELSKHELEVLNLNNKITLLQEDVVRQEKRVDEVKEKYQQGEKDEGLMSTLEKKVGLLESQIDEKEAARKEAVEKYFILVIINYFRSRSLELVAETAERKVRQLEGEKSQLEAKLAEMVNQYNAVKSELAETLKGLEDL